MDTLTPQYEEWLTRNGVPIPRIGGSFAYCPHQETTTVKEPKKRAKTVYVPCKFKSRSFRKYARHYRRRHGA